MLLEAVGAPRGATLAAAALPPATLPEARAAMLRCDWLAPPEYAASSRAIGSESDHVAAGSESELSNCGIFPQAGRGGGGVQRPRGPAAAPLSGGGPSAAPRDHPNALRGRRLPRVHLAVRAGGCKQPTM
eukprot:8324659-Pyramimonas_sp.AAC.1